jgi:hypothetical protein
MVHISYEKDTIPVSLHPSKQNETISAMDVKSHLDKLLQA